MQSKYTFVTVAIVLLILALGCAHMGDPCENKLLSRIPSPDGSLVLSTYHRECSSKIYTTAALEKPAGFMASGGEVVCYVLSWGDRHPIEAVWKDEKNILISTTDRLEKFDFEGSKEFCNGVNFSYHVKFRDERQQNVDPRIVPKIRKVLTDTGSCINAYYKAAYEHNDPVKDIEEMIRRGEHRSAVENILGYTYSAACPLSSATYNDLEELSEAFDLKPAYLERVAPLVK